MCLWCANQKESAAKQRESDDDWLWLSPFLDLEVGLVRNDPRPTPEPKVPEPTAEETARWLKQSLEGETTLKAGYAPQTIWRLSFSPLSSRQPYCLMSLTERWHFTRTEPRDEIYEVPLNIVEKAGVANGVTISGPAVGQPDGSIYVYLNFQQNISYESVTSSQREELKRRDVYLPVPTRELAERASKAFNRLIQLCGGGNKKEPF